MDKQLLIMISTIAGLTALVLWIVRMGYPIHIGYPIGFNVVQAIALVLIRRNEKN
jgi:hypothetical protein